MWFNVDSDRLVYVELYVCNGRFCKSREHEGQEFQGQLGLQNMITNIVKQCHISCLAHQGRIVFYMRNSSLGSGISRTTWAANYDDKDLEAIT